MAQEEARMAVSPPDQVQMAIERTYLAHDRTLLAWVRTGTSLVTFGFTLYKFFQYLNEQDPQRHPAHILGTRTLGLLMVAIGVVTLGLACWQHQQSIKRLRAHYPEIPFSPAYVLAALMSVLGILALIAPLL
jgi:putative membrane protein